jgi:biopolymer transport protein ExbD
VRQLIKRGRISSEINITPFTDVVLVLLVIFMITTPLMVQSGIQVKLPKVAQAETDEGEMLTIMIDPAGTIFLNGKAISPENLKATLTATLSNKPDQTVVVKADKETKYDWVVNAIDIAKQSGAKKFALGVEIKNQPK